jgi:hypothetical protein
MGQRKNKHLVGIASFNAAYKYIAKQIVVALAWTLNETNLVLFMRLRNEITTIYTSVSGWLMIVWLLRNPWLITNGLIIVGEEIMRTCVCVCARACVRACVSACVCVWSFRRFVGKAAEGYEQDGRVSCRYLNSSDALLSDHETKCVEYAAVRFRVLWIWKEQSLPK